MRTQSWIFLFFSALLMAPTAGFKNSTIEPYHPLYHINKPYYSHKSKKAGLNYEIAISVLKVELFRSMVHFQQLSILKQNHALGEKPLPPTLKQEYKDLYDKILGHQ